MANKKYVAYVSTYTMKNKNGITIYDVDVADGKLQEKGVVEITNSSYLTCSHNNKYLYSITDMGVKGYRILADGMLEEINYASINGMRGCYLSTDYDDKFLFVAGYHDGKITVLRLAEDGSIGEITEEIYVVGMGDVMERSFHPHVNCVKMSRDNRYLLAADSGMDHVNVYELNHTTGKLKQMDIIRSDVGSGPKHMVFSKDGRFLYIVHEIKNYIDVYTYKYEDKYPEFEKIQTISTVNEYHAGRTVTSMVKLTMDGKHLISSNAGDNSVVVFDLDVKTGLLAKNFCLPVSGTYPKDAAMFPDLQHLVSLNHESNTMTFFTADLDKHIIAMSSKEIKIEKPNCIIFYELKQ
ncbi:MAG: lactonase family protein [Lachnospiraceae bacterium]|nr:lactonase family protein [Lachnospiraceae bacterium]